MPPKTDILDRLAPAALIEHYADAFVEGAFKVVMALAILIAGVWITRWLAAAVNRFARKHERIDNTLAAFFASIVRYGLLAFVLIAVLDQFGVQTTQIVAVLGAATLAIGLALQGTLTNFASGVMLLIFRPFKVGDHVKVAGIDGVVEAIDLFTCEFKSPDNRRLIVPNNAIFGATIDNITHFPERRVDVNVSSPYDSDLDATRAALERALSRVPGALSEPEPEVFLAGLGSSTVNWQLRVWCTREDYWAVFQATVREAKIQLEDTRIQTPG